MAYESFAALNRILESAERKRESDRVRSLQMLQLGIGLKQYEEGKTLESTRYTAKTTLEASRHAEVLAAQTDIREHQQTLAIRTQDYQDKVLELKTDLQEAQLDEIKYKQIKEKLTGLDLLQTGSGQKIAKGFHFGLGLTPVDSDEWYSDMHKNLTSTRRGRLAMTDRQATMLLQSGMAASKGDFVPTLDLMREIDVSVRTFNEVITGRADSKSLNATMVGLIDIYGKLGVIEQLDRGEVDGIAISGLKFVKKWDTLFNHAESVRSNRAGIAKETRELLQDDDLALKFKTEEIEYELIDQSIKALDAAKAKNDLDDLLGLFENELKINKSETISDLDEKKHLIDIGWDVGQTKEQIDKQISILADKLRDENMQEIYRSKSPLDKAVFDALDDLELPHTDENIDLMKSQMTKDPDYEEAMMGF